MKKVYERVGLSSLNINHLVNTFCCYYTFSLTSEMWRLYYEYKICFVLIKITQPQLNMFFSFSFIINANNITSLRLVQSNGCSICFMLKDEQLTTQAITHTLFIFIICMHCEHLYLMINCIIDLCYLSLSRKYSAGVRIPFIVIVVCNLSNGLHWKWRIML